MRPFMRLTFIYLSCDKSLEPDNRQKGRQAGIMKKGLTEIVFILDRSGSMSGLEADTIGGYNSMLDKQKTDL